MPDYQFNTNLGPAPQQGTSLGDLINTARGVQAYQQSQELNPLQLQKARMEIEQLQKTNPFAAIKAEEEANQAKIGTQSAQTKLSSEKMQKFLDTVGARATDQELLSAVEKKDISKVKDLISGDIQELITNKVLTPAEAMQAGARMLDLADKNLDSVVPALKNLVTRSASPESRLGLQTPKLTTNAAGQLVGANQITNQLNVLGTPQTNPMGVRTQTFTDPVTGNLIQAPLTPQGTLGAPSNIMGSPQPDVAPNKNPLFQFGNPAPQSNAPQAIPQGATAETVKAQATDAMNTFMTSNKLLSDASVPGHIPTQEFVAKKLLTYIKDPSVNTGPIADVLAGKTNQASLSAKEQEVVKLIQQRIQNLNPRTDADAESKKAAYGSFKLKKEALEDLVRDDLGSIVNQKLLAQGVVKSGGDPNRPNLQGVNTFKNDFTKFSQNPILMRYIGIVGTKNTVDLDKSDEQALKKLYSTYKISKEDRNALEDAREELVKMSAGGQ
jgi:hypothetical protein